MEIPKAYDPKQAEERHYARWESEGCFAPEINGDPAAPVYSIVIPPPNVTGSLHMGHALQHTIMDVLTRFHRMRGFRTLWLPGTDHAGISTQIMVERQLKKAEGKTRHDIGRDEFLRRVWSWKEQYGGEIIRQMKREGLSVDWSRHCFTMDEHLTRAVREFFVRCYEEGLIYRGPGIINWCPKDQTALSDLEVDKEAQAGRLYYLQYPVKGSDRRVTVATTRPETMLGDTAVAVNPSDERFKDLVGATLLLPIVNREIPVVADDFVDPEFGTGAVKVTPAHDPNDYAMGKRHGLPLVTVIDERARMTAEAGAEFEGLDRYEARERVVAEFERAGLLEKVVDYEFSITKCGRCRTVIEPLVSTQWFLKQAELAREPLRLVTEKHEPRFVPETPYEKVYRNWLENLHDWTLSRQLWWGHRIPAWYDEAGNVYVARSEEEAREKAGTDGLAQDPDVLDTWFSSALWPISTLGWPDATDDLKTFYPTSVLVTARDIIFLWVSRMMMTGMKFTGEKAFEDVYITGTVFARDGQRMSKTKQNGVDPLDVFDKYGVDATRVVLASIGSTDTRWNDNQVESYRNFANKIWNAARFCLLNSEGAQVGRGFEGEPAGWALHDRWIVSRLNRAARDVGRAIETYQFHEAVYSLYHFFWDDFCDWYIELSKPDVTAAEPGPARDAARSRVVTVLEQALRLLHPFMPYITEELWQRLPGVGAHSLHAAYGGAPVTPTIMLADYPRAEESLIDERAEAEMQAVIDLISRVRNIRTELSVRPGEYLPRVFVGTPDAGMRRVFANGAGQIARLARASKIFVGDRLERFSRPEGREPSGNGELAPPPPWPPALDATDPDGRDIPRASARAVLAGGAEVAVPLEGLIDFEQERARIGREVEKLAKESEKLEAQLANPQFVERAPAEKVEELRARAEDIRRRSAALEQMLEALG
ncbi:MAG TPA: valine--tRNA ligase [Pyrinomonadaceae bacterium]|nr:valine--tRNA ligase [Pyrinomonadaceae bacterium]